MDSFTIDISKTKYNLKVGQYIDIINEKHGVEEFALQCETLVMRFLLDWWKSKKIICLENIK